MKNITSILITLLLAICAPSFASVQTEQVTKFSNTFSNTITIPSQFGKDFIDEKVDLSPLKGLEIHHVDLVYTAYKSAEDFNQRGLNERRMRKLIALLPQLKKKDPSWRAICQTGATNLDEAKQYFHGFVLHLGAPIEYQGQAKFFEEFRQEPTVYTIDNATKTSVKYASGTTISIPPNAVVDKQGKPVEGDYELVYQEYRNQADIVFSGIPMTYNSDGMDYNFSSVGMYEIRANQNGEELVLNKPIQIDFNATDQKEGVGFFKMDDETGEWEKIQDVSFENDSKPKTEGFSDDIVIEKFTDEQVMDLLLNSVNDKSFSYASTDVNEERHYLISDLIIDGFMNHLDTSDEVANKIISMDTSINYIRVKLSDGKEFDNQIWYSFTNAIKLDKQEFGAPLQNDKNATLLAAGSGDAGHTYPKVVKGLNSKDFGVYNCDQIYRIGKSKSISPKYVDASTGKEIAKQKVTCVLDLTYNGSFSFHPNFVTCNLEGKNVFLLFTADKKTYMLDAETFASMDVTSTPRPVFAMKDMTSEIKSSADLSRILKL